jgi:phosphinothricin acetyltransferase
MAGLVICDMQEQDWPDVVEIYRQGMRLGNATLETDIPSWEQWNATHLPGCRFVARQEGQIRGWAALTPASGRCVYVGVAEVSVYVSETALRQGVGTALLQALIEASECEGIWTLQSGILVENKASLALHARCGFRVVGRRERLGQLNGVWRDVVLLERRSQVVGT